MLKTLPSQQRGLNCLRLMGTLTPLIGVALLSSTGMRVEAQPVVVVQPQLCSSIVYGSPIPAAVPRNPVTGQPCSGSSYGYGVYNSYGIPATGVIQDSTLINPTIINSRVSDSVLVNPVIINSPRFPRSTIRPSVIYSPPAIYNPPGVRIRIGQ